MSDVAIEPGTDLYRRAMAYDYGDNDRQALMKQVWEPTPWMADVYTGSGEVGRTLDMIHWCRERFGPESYPIHGVEGAWRRGNATIDGWTWYGFKTEEMLQEFLAAWPTPKGVEKT